MKKKYYQRPTISIVAIRQMSMLCNSIKRGAKTFRNNGVTPEGWQWEGTLSDNDDDC